MRKFLSYGPIDTDIHFYAPRINLINQVLNYLLGDPFDKGGHYITVWAPRQRGKTWLMQQVQQRLKESPLADTVTVAALSLEQFRTTSDPLIVLRFIAQAITAQLALNEFEVGSTDQFHDLFSRESLSKPLILILDEFDALDETIISELLGVFRSLYTNRQFQPEQPSGQRQYVLHGLALIGVRSVLGIENMQGSPFNIQRSVNIPNLTAAEVNGLFRWYESESGQRLDQSVIDRVFYETLGQPGLVSWLGELLTETYNTHQPLITMREFETVYSAALEGLPNNNILNIISKARKEPYQQLVLEMFKTDQKLPFRYDDPTTNYLYMHGVVDQEVVERETAEQEDVGKIKRYLKFPSPFVQKRLFNYFANAIFPRLGRLQDPFDTLEDTVSDTMLNVRRLLQRYEQFLRQNRQRLLKDAPRRELDLRVYEAVYHFNLYLYLMRFLDSYDARVYPEFPTGNGKIDLLIKHAGQLFGLELKSFSSPRDYRKALQQAAAYAQQLRLQSITLVLFIDAVDDDHRHQYEAIYTDSTTGVVVEPVFVATGE